MLAGKRSFNERTLNMFLDVVYNLLENNLHDDIFTWSKEGTCVFIKDVSRFANEVLREHFGHQKLYSFIRQLNLYGFKKTRRDSSCHEYVHPLFKRGERDLLNQIKRKKPIKKQLSIEDEEEALDLQTHDCIELEQQSRQTKKIQKDSFEKRTGSLSHGAYVLEDLRIENEIQGNELNYLQREFDQTRGFVLELLDDNQRLFVELQNQKQDMELLKQQLDQMKSMLRASVPIPLKQLVQEEIHTPYNFISQRGYNDTAPVEALINEYQMDDRF